jgi:hypothetical protein
MLFLRKANIGKVIYIIRKLVFILIPVSAFLSRVGIREKEALYKGFGIGHIVRGNSRWAW